MDFDVAPGTNTPIKQEELSPVLKQIIDMQLNYPDRNTREAYYTSGENETNGNTKFAEDYILMMLKDLVQNPINIHSKISYVAEELNKKTMQLSLKREFFINAIKELAQKLNYSRPDLLENLK